MSLASSKVSYSDVIGCFNHADTGACFEYSNTDNAWPQIATEYPHLIYCDEGKQVRHANVKKTVAYIVTDEDARGQPVVEKWQIRHQWKRQD